MTITIHPTDKIVDLQEGASILPARIWEGETDTGIPVHCFVTRICPTIPVDDARQAIFQRELQETRPATVPGIPLRLIL